MKDPKNMAVVELMEAMAKLGLEPNHHFDTFLARLKGMNKTFTNRECVAILNSIDYSITFAFSATGEKNNLTEGLRDKILNSIDYSITFAFSETNEKKHLTEGLREKFLNNIDYSITFTFQAEKRA